MKGNIVTGYNSIAIYRRATLMYQTASVQYSCRERSLKRAELRELERAEQQNQQQRQKQKQKENQGWW